mmetsp:Transcript_45002/g.88078  ORF Transcript_45002/g.88078 Transcript_45002/m.88078 type:complete len:343 (+) Transcript_45002:126-1154(+)
MMPSARLPLLFLLLLRSPRVSADDQSKSLLGAITDATSEAIGALEDVTNPFEEVDLGNMEDLLSAGQGAFNAELESGLEELVDLVPENVDIGALPIDQIPNNPFDISSVGEAVAAGIQESRGVGDIGALPIDEVMAFLSDTVQADNPDVILPMDLVGAAVATIEKFTSFTIDVDDLMAQLLEMAAMTAEEQDAFDLADVVSGMLEDSVIASIYESLYDGFAEMATEEGIDLEALQATFAENMEDLDPLEVDDLAGAMITTIQETFGIEINPEPLTAAARTLIENPATFDPNDLTFAVSAAVSQETVETVDPGTAMEESGTARCGRASFLLVAMVLSLFGILA